MAVDEIQPETDGIQIIITQDQNAFGLSRSFGGDPECTGVTQMKMAGGRRRKTPAIAGSRQDEGSVEDVC